MTPVRRNLWLAIAVVAVGQAAALGWMIWDRVSGATYYVTLKKSPGDIWKIVAGGTEAPSAPAADEVVLKGRVEYATGATPEGPAQIGVHYGIESFFVPEGTGRELEKMVGEKKLSALIAVDKSGNAAIKGLLSEGKRVYEEPLL
jgi:hypothetical protein